jgi:uncharacterized RDD family membrane protein YckC
VAKRRQPPIAGIGRRFLALLLDVLLLNLLAAVVIGAQMQEAAGVGALSALVGAWLYNAGLESSPAQATLGKLLLGMRVTDVSGRRISFVRASLRFIAKIVSGLVLALGYLVAFFTPMHQALHDLVARTLVVRRASAAGSARAAQP